MQIPLRLLTLSLLGSMLSAQNSLVFCGRFPFQSLDTVNERPDGSITKLEEFDFSVVTPGAGAVAKSLQPATAHQAYYGDGNADGNYTKFFGFKTYFQNVQMGGLFMKFADKFLLKPENVFFTVRANVAGLDFEAFTNNGTSVAVLRPGDFVRFTSNGNLEYFVTQDQIDVAAGLPPTGFSSIKGASAMCQDAAGNLYYSPAQGGQWINGNLGGPFLANDGSIVMIPASAITYDALGNVQGILPNSAQMLLEEVNLGPGPNPMSVRQLVLNAQTYDRAGNPIAVTGVYGRTAGLDLDPNGGTFLPNFPDATGAYPPAPNFVFCSDAASYGGSIWSTANGGSPAVINGVTCASTTLGVPADASWLGVQLSVANNQPAYMGMIVTGPLLYEPFVLDMPNFGAINQNTTQASIDIDMHHLPLEFPLVFADFNIAPIGGFAPSVATGLVPLPLDPFSHWQLFPLFAPLNLGLVLTDINGYGTLSIPNPHNGPFLGVPMILQAVVFDAAGAITISNPVQAQFK